MIPFFKYSFLIALGGGIVAFIAFSVWALATQPQQSDARVLLIMGTVLFIVIGGLIALLTNPKDHECEYCYDEVSYEAGRKFLIGWSLIYLTYVVPLVYNLLDGSLGISVTTK